MLVSVRCKVTLELLAKEMTYCDVFSREIQSCCLKFYVSLEYEMVSSQDICCM